jgi:hypothetical protein
MVKLNYLDKHKKIGIFLIIIFFLLSTIPTSYGFLPSLKLPKTNIPFEETQNGKYEGMLKVHLVEPHSRWVDSDDQIYHFGFLEYLLNEPISIYYNQTYSTEKTILIDELDFTDINKTNTMFIAAVFNEQNHTKYAYPPSQNPFDAYYNDATAACYPNEIGYNQKNDNYTHTVFIEEGTANWCHNCPPVSTALHEIYTTEDLPFYFTSMVSDKNINAQQRLEEDYNILGYPSLFFDGGNEIIVGNKEKIKDLCKTTIMQCGSRDVHDLNLSISSIWNTNQTFKIIVTIKNMELKTPDQIDPELTILQPLNGFYINNNKLSNFPTVCVFGSIDFIVNAIDNNSGIQDVKIFIDNELKVELNPDENIWTWNEKSFGRHKVTIIATDNIGNQKNELRLTLPSGEGPWIVKPELEIIPIKAGLYFLIPLGGRSYFTLDAGAGWYLVDYHWYWKGEDGSGYWAEMNQEASAQDIGYHAGLGFEIGLGPHIAFLLEGRARFAEIDGFEGTLEYKDSFGDSDLDEGKLYYWREKIFSEKFTFVLINESDSPSFTGLSTAEFVREAVVDLTGVSLQAGFKIKF